MLAADRGAGRSCSDRDPHGADIGSGKWVSAGIFLIAVSGLATLAWFGYRRWRLGALGSRTGDTDDSDNDHVRRVADGLAEELDAVALSASAIVGLSALSRPRAGRATSSTMPSTKLRACSSKSGLRFGGGIVQPEDALLRLAVLHVPEPREHRLDLAAGDDEVRLVDQPPAVLLSRASSAAGG